MGAVQAAGGLMLGELAGLGVLGGAGGGDWWVGVAWDVSKGTTDKA